MQIGLFAAFGGGIVSSLLLQDPVSAPIALFHSNYLGLVWTTCWWLMNYCPKDLVASAHGLLPVRLVTKICLNILRAGLIASRVDLSVYKYPGVIAAPLVIGTIAGSGGKFLQDGIQLACGSLHGPTEVTAPGFASRTGFAGTLAYYISVHVLEVLKPAQGLALITTVFVVHGVLADVLKQPLDWTHPLAVITHAVANIPMPALQPASKQAAAKGPKGKQSAQSVSHSSTDVKKDR
ncbi:TPA: hypothetical protein ACH3X1_001883 [Trebouxia sp. C0004]